MRPAKSAIERQLSRLAGNEAGATLLVLAILWMPLAGLTSVAIEYGHALKLRSELQNAADAAAEAGARNLDAGEIAVAVSIRETLDAQLRQSGRGLPFSFAVHDGMLGIRIDASVATRFAALFGKPAFRFAVTSSADLSIPRLPDVADRPDPAAADADADQQAIEAEVVLERGSASPVTVLSVHGPRG